MSMENVKQFLELVKTDEGLARKVVELKDSLQGSAGAGNENEILAEKVLPLAKAHGLEFTVEEFLAYASSVSGELSDDDLLNVSGGISARGVALGLLFATGLSFVPTIVSSFATGGDSSMPSAPETAISQSYDTELEEDSSIELEERKSEKEVRSSREDVRRASGQVRAAQKRVDVLESKLKKDAGVDNVNNLTKKQKKKFSKLINQIELAKEDLSAAQQKLEASKEQTDTAEKVKTDVKEKNASIIKERLERKETENNRKQFARVMKELLESKRDQNEAVVSLADNELEEKHEERQDEINEQVENKEKELEKKDEIVEEKKEEVAGDKKEERKVETREEAVKRIRGEIDATIEKYKDRLSDEEKNTLNSLKDGIGNQTWYADAGAVQTAWNFALNKLREKDDTNNVDANADYDAAAGHISGFFDTDVNDNEEKEAVDEEKKEEVVEEKKEEVIEEEEEKNGDVVEEKKEEVNEHADENKEHLQQETSTEQKKAELVKGLKDNSLVYSSKGEIKGFESDIYVAMKNAKILDLSEEKQKQMLTDAIKDVLSESSEEQIASFVDVTFDKFSSEFSSAKNQEANRFEMKSAITDRTAIVKQIQVKDKIDELSDTYGGTMSKDSKGKLEKLKTQAFGATKEMLAEIEETLKETEETLKKEAEQYNAKLKELKKRADDIDDSLYALEDDKNYDTLDAKYQVIKSELEQGNPDLKQIENDINELEKLIKKSNEKELSQVEFEVTGSSRDALVEGLYDSLIKADFDLDRIKNKEEWKGSCAEALKLMTTYNDTLQIYYYGFGKSCGSKVTDYKHKAMLKTLALFAMELDKKIDKGTAKTFANKVTTVENGKINVNASETQVKISEDKGNNITLKEFVEGKK